MQSLDALFSYVQPEVPSCPVGLVRNAIRRAAIEFCEETLAYDVTTALIPLVNTVTVAANVFTWGGPAAVPLVGTRLSFPVSADSALVVGTHYFVVNVVGSAFQLSLTLGGAAITGITDNAVAFNAVVDSFVIALPSAHDRLVMPRNIWASNRELVPKSMAQIALLLPDWQTSQGDPAYYNMPTSTSVRLFPLPVNQQVSSTLTIRAAFAPTITATQLGDDLINIYAEAVTMKAKSILMLMAKQPWSDPQMGAVYREDFMVKCDEAKIEMLHDRTQGSLRVSPRSFY